MAEKNPSFKDLGFSQVGRATVNQKTGAISVSVSSDAVNQLRWLNSTLSVTFNHGGTYTYGGVSREQFNQILSAPSIGRYLNRNIIPHKRMR